MKKIHLAVIVGWCLVLGANQAQVMAQDITDDDVEDAITDLKKYFYRKFDHNKGNWETLYRHVNGGKGAITSMIVQALLQSGESSQKPEIKRAIEYLASIKNDRTYGVAVRCHVWSLLPDKYLPQLKYDADWLVNKGVDVNGTFTYHQLPVGKKIHTTHDHSTTHYGALGLWEASKRGIPVRKSFWIANRNHWIGSQKGDGGWSYEDGQRQPVTSSMTAAGLTSLFIAQQQLTRDRLSAEPEITGSINEGLMWLDKSFEKRIDPRTQGATAYYFYAMERVALASGRRHFNKLDWFRVGATNFIKHKLPSGAIGFHNVESPVDSAYALMFLTRGRVPVWVNKIKIPNINTRWNNRPNDAYYLTKFINSKFEQEVSWQVISIDAKPEQWLDAPIAYLATDSEFELKKERVQNLKRFLDEGGLLLASPDNTGDGVEKFTTSVKKLAKTMYPNLQFKQLKDDHPIFNLLYQLEGMAGQKIFSLNNGARDLIIMPEKDWGYLFQSEKQIAEPTTTFRLAANFYALATDRGRLKLVNRLAPHFVPRQKRAKIGKVEIARGRYESKESNWLVEPMAWQQVSNFIYNSFGIDVVYNKRDTLLTRAGLCKAPLIHVTGTRPIKLTSRELAELARYIRKGNTILVENVGGTPVKKGKNGKWVFQPNFAESIERQLAAAGGRYREFRAAAVPLAPAHPILSGKDMIGGFDNRFVNYRPWVVQLLPGVRRPRLAAIHVPGKNGKLRPAVIFSREDLSLGMLGLRHYGVVGYSLESSRNLMTNMAIYAYEQSK